jgi:hypothetical protein
MSEDEQRTAANEEAGDEVEAHKRVANANEEPGKEGDDDVEGHMRRAAPDAEGGRTA